MRFEIKAGGWILITVGLLGLSVIVFAFGIYAGYDMARSTAPEAPQAASVYPLPSPPVTSELANAPAKSSEKTASTSAASAGLAKTKPLNSGAGSLAMDKDAGPLGASPSHASANAAASIPPARTASDDNDTGAKPRVTNPAGNNPAANYASATDASAGQHHKPFNIQIDAAMDRTNAEQMTARLQKLGYHAFMVPTDISGQTWWRVRVGPFQSQEEASTAEQELRAKYRDTYTP